jgi:large subunit ribosomal protein L9
MEVILREHVENLGRRGDLVKVADGYARNYLLPRKMALSATPANKKIIERERRILDVREAAEKADADALAARLAAVECTIARRVGENDTLYGSVTAADVAEVLTAKGFDIDKRTIQLHDPLKQLGEFSVPVKLHHSVVGQVKVIVTPLQA